MVILIKGCDRRGPDCSLEAAKVSRSCYPDTLGPVSNALVDAGADGWELRPLHEE